MQYNYVNFVYTIPLPTYPHNSDASRRTSREHPGDRGGSGRVGGVTTGDRVRPVLQTAQ